MAPHPDNFSSNFFSLSNPSLSHSVTYWAGLKLPPLSLSYTIITRLTTWNMNTPRSPWQPRKPHVISLDLGSAANSHSTQRLGLCQMGRILQLIFQHVVLWVRPVKPTQKIYNSWQGKKKKSSPITFQAFEWRHNRTNNTNSLTFNSVIKLTNC